MVPCCRCGCLIASVIFVLPVACCLFLRSVEVLCACFYLSGDFFFCGSGLSV